MISTISLTQKFFKKGYTGNLPKNYDDLLNLYTSLYGPPDLDNWSKDKLVVKIKEYGYDKPIPSTLQELRKLFLQLYKPKFQPKQSKSQQLRKSTIHDFTIAKLKENIKKLGYKGPNKKTKKEWYDLYVEYTSGPKGEKNEKYESSKEQMTVQQLKDELIKLGYKGGMSKKKKDDLIQLYTTYKKNEIDGAVIKPMEEPKKDNVAPQGGNMTISLLKNELIKLGYTGGLSSKKKQDLIDLYNKLLVEKKVIPQPVVEEKQQPVAVSPVKQLNLEYTTINELKHQVKKLGYTGPVQKNKQGWIDVYKKLIDSSCKQVGKFTYSITPLGLTKPQIETKFQGKNVGIVYTVCKDKKCTFTIDDAKKYKEFVFTMQNSKGTYDGMEINEHQVLTIDELPENLYDKLIGKCDIKDVSEQVMNFIEKIEKKTKSVCDNLLDNYKIIPIDKDGNCFFHAIGNALNIPTAKVREMMVNKLTQKLVDIRNEFSNSNKTLEEYKNELMSDGTFVSDYDVEQLFPIAFPDTGLIILNMNSVSGEGGCDITCSSNLLENKKKYIVLLFQRDLSQDKDDGAHYDLISINSKPVLSHGDLSDKLIQHVHKQCKTINLVNQVIEPNIIKPTIEKQKAIPEFKIEKPKEVENIELMKKEDVTKVLKEKGYTGILPKYKTEMIEIYNKLYTVPDKNDTVSKPLDKMTIQELQTELQKKNITKYLPRTKSELIKLYNADRCDPVQDQWCGGEQVCDLRNNVCLDKEDIKPTKNTSIVFDTMNDHPIAGTSANLYQLKQAIKNKKQVEPISITIPTSIETSDVIKVQSIDELKKTLIDLAQQNSFYKLISQLV